MLGDITAADEIYIVTGRTICENPLTDCVRFVEDQLHMDPRRMPCTFSAENVVTGSSFASGSPMDFACYINAWKFRADSAGINQLEVKQLTWQQFDWLMSGLEIEQPKAFKPTE